MTLFDIKYQTSGLVPAPFAFATEVSINLKSLEYSFLKTYLDRDQLSEEEIYDEGFTLNDDVDLKGKLHANWATALEKLLENTKKTFPTEISEKQDYWEITDNETTAFYPLQTREWLKFLEEFQQAATEQNKLEKPLHISILRNSSEAQETIELIGVFETRTLIQKQGEKETVLSWDRLNDILKNIFGGDYIYEKAHKSKPKSNGLFVNLDDEFWFEVGKSLLIKPSKITSWIEN